MGRVLLVAASACLVLLVAGCGTSQPASDTTAQSTGAAGVPSQHTFEADHFAANAIVGDVATEPCTLSGGTTTTCARVTVAGYPSTYQVGPFCPATITTTAQDAGIWFDGSGVYNLDGPFIKNLAQFYSDSEWKLYDSAGNVNVTNTKEAFDGAARKGSGLLGRHAGEFGGVDGDFRHVPSLLLWRAARCRRAVPKSLR